MPPPIPENGIPNGHAIEEEYEEMTMDEIMNGKVRFLFRVGGEKSC